MVLIGGQKEEVVRQRIRVRGTVQGVGFRPFVYRVALAEGIAGRVWNDGHGVVIEGQGAASRLEAFLERLKRELPPLAAVERWEVEKTDLVQGEGGFDIVASEGGKERADAGVTVDSAVCGDCLGEMRKGGNRRYRHGLINCTNCGPRYSIIQGVPYDRLRTTMARFAMCPRCAHEYGDPADRRFHAEPLCCPSCGPTVRLVVVRRGGEVREVNGDPIVKAAALLTRGKILAVKGIGGFHLAVRADSEAAVGRLRQFKKRDAKPFAVMCRNMEGVRELVALTAAGEEAVQAVAAPIVLGRRRKAANVAESVARGTHLLGVMLPYTPLQHLLMDAMARQCERVGQAMPALVMTSGNVAGEPLVIEDAEAVERLGGVCDALLLHDREIERPVDDSVVLDVGSSAGCGRENGTVPVRRSRGFVPMGWALPVVLAGQAHATGVCVGGELKNTVAVLRGRDVILSQHLGDLSHPRALEHFRKAVADLVRLFEVRVDFVAHDLHPGYLSTMAAKELAVAHGAQPIAVQHHHAHAAAVMAEHGVRGPLLAIVCDGTGYGTDGTIWGGEVLVINRGKYRRVGRLKPMRLPGGDSAACDPRRSGLSLLHGPYGPAFAETAAARRLFAAEAERSFLANMIVRGVSSPWTSSTGRLFDGVAALLGVCAENAHEAQAAMALEAAAFGADAAVEMEMDISWNATAGLWELDPGAWVRRMVERVEAGADRGALAAEFHCTLARGLAAVAEKVAVAEKLDSVVCSGGVFCNARMVEAVRREGTGRRLRTYFHKLYPPTDGGVALGQAAVITERLLTGSLSFDKRLFDRNI